MIQPFYLFLFQFHNYPRIYILNLNLNHLRIAKPTETPSISITMEPSHISSLPSPASATFASENDRRTLQQLLQARPDLKFGLFLVEPSWLPGEDEGPALSLQVTVSQRPDSTYSGRGGASNSLGTGLDEEVEQSIIDTVEKDLTALLDQLVAKSYKPWEEPNRALIGGCCPTHIKQLKLDIVGLASDYAKYLPSLPGSALEQLGQKPPNPPDWISCQSGGREQGSYTFSANPTPASVTRTRNKVSDYPCEYPSCVTQSILTNPLTRVEFGRRLQQGELGLHIKSTQLGRVQIVKTEANWVAWTDDVMSEIPTVGSEAQLKVLRPVGDLLLARVNQARRSKLTFATLFAKDDLASIIENLRNPDRGSHDDIFGKLKVTVEKGQWR